MTSDRQDISLEEVVDSICKRGFRLPAILLLESSKPLRGMFENSTVLLDPILRIIVGGALTQRVLEIVSDSSQIENLITLLETKDGN